MRYRMSPARPLSNSSVFYPFSGVNNIRRRALQPRVGGFTRFESRYAAFAAHDLVVGDTGGQVIAAWATCLAFLVGIRSIFSDRRSTKSRKEVQHHVSSPTRTDRFRCQSCAPRRTV